MCIASNPNSTMKQDKAVGEDAQAQPQQEQQPPAYRWCKCFFEPEQPGAQNYYFMHFDTRQTQYEEPSEPYWIWDAMLNNVHASGLQYPTSIQRASYIELRVHMVELTKSVEGQTAPATSSTAQQSSEPDPEYQGYNPKIHGSYDPNAPYAQYHKSQSTAESALQDYQTATALHSGTAPPGTAPPGEYGATGAFNRFTGRFQTSEQSTERHSDAAKSGRQLNAFFDVDAAANSHDGKSLKEERRQQKLSKKEIQELSKKRRDKKEKKRMDFYKS